MFMEIKSGKCSDGANDTKQGSLFYGTPQATEKSSEEQQKEAIGNYPRHMGRGIVVYLVLPSK